MMLLLQDLLMKHKLSCSALANMLCILQNLLMPHRKRSRVMKGPEVITAATLLRRFRASWTTEESILRAGKYACLSVKLSASRHLHLWICIMLMSFIMCQWKEKKNLGARIRSSGRFLYKTLTVLLRRFHHTTWMIGWCQHKQQPLWWREQESCMDVHWKFGSIDYLS